jgi:hypothetical protein
MSSSAHSDKEFTEPDNTNVGLIATVTIVGALLVFAIALSLDALVRSESAVRGVESGTFADLGTVSRLKAEQRAKLDAPLGWADKDKGKVALPIERAMEVVTAEIRKDPSLATTTAAAPAATASAESPAPAAPAPAPAPAKPEDNKK